ncbi:MAG: hypothetical protein DRR16_05550 [Candidatus Parabeggiatoa sp. nov. 3]|nr:MAG: hypothetical protein DRR00_17515 [Gammaproteobacteria bacterium]RKZ88189.1 MAG: hypothetical protein DRR16_05550 [Gammaproteobacteria bacterium]
MKWLLRSLESIDLECHRFENESVNKKALRMDGERGIRKQLGLENYNCCDYLFTHQDNLYLIEISDFVIQRDNLQKNHSIKEIKKIIRQEIRLKIMGSLIILFKIPTQFSISHEKIHTGKIRVILILCSDDSSDVVAFDYLQTDLKTALSPLITEVIVMNISMFRDHGNSCSKKITS